MSETKSIYTCQICQREFKNAIDIGKHIKTHRISSKDYYDKFIKTENDGICIECGNETNYLNLNLGYKIFCSQKCVGSSEITQHKKNKTCLGNYGYLYTLQVPELRDKKDNTMMERHGGKHAMQVPEFMNKKVKSSFKSKSYIRLSGKEIFIQGNEPQAMDILSQYFTEEELIAGTTEIPSIPYFFNKKKRVYHPDIWIPSINTLVEVKSPYTMYNIEGPMTYDKNIAKHNFAIEAGYDHEFMIIK